MTNAQCVARFGTHGRVLIVDLTTRTSRVETHRRVGLQQLPRRLRARRVADVEALPGRAPTRSRRRPASRSCSGLLTGRAHAVLRAHPDRRQVAAHRHVGRLELGRQRRAASCAAPATTRCWSPARPASRRCSSSATARCRFEPAGELWGQEIPPVFDALRARFGGKREVGVSAIGPAGEQQSRIASVMNDRYHAFGRQGFGAIYGSKNLKAIVVAGIGRGADRRPDALPGALQARSPTSTRATSSWLMRFMVWFTKPKRWLGWMYRLMTRFGMKVEAPQQAMRQLWSERGTTARGRAQRSRTATRRSRTGRASARRDFPLATQEHASSTAPQVDKYITKKLSCGDCPMPCKGIVAVKSRGLTRRAPPGLRDDRRLRRQPPERRPRARHRVPRRVQPLRHRRGQLERDARLGVRGGRGGHPHAGRPRRHRHALGQRRGRARADDQDGHRRGLRRVAAATASARAAAARRQGQRARSPCTSTARSPRTTTRASPR